METSVCDKTICIVGPRKTQNDILADFLEKKLDARCIVSADAARLDLPANSDGKYRPLVLLDSPENGLDKYFMSLKPESKRTLNRHTIALFNVRPNSGIEAKAISMGIRGLFYVQDSCDRFVKGISAMFEGDLWYSREAMSRLIIPMKNENCYDRETVALTKREREILTMVITGSKYEEIADRLFISTNTVRTHIHNIYRKINVPNRIQAALWAVTNL